MSADRKENGRFAPGNAGGPGRPPRATERDYLAAMSAIVTPEKWQAIIERAMQDALSGDGEARRFLAKFLLGECPPTLSQLDGQGMGLTALEITRRTLLNPADAMREISSNPELIAIANELAERKARASQHDQLSR